MQHAIYSGFVIHNRKMPTKHKFMYKLRLFFLDVDNVAEAFKKVPFISINKFNFLSFARKNYLPSIENSTIRQEVERILTEHGYQLKPRKIFILTHLSYLGYCYNPVSFFYCYDEQRQLTHILAEVNNTPWNERYVYVHNLSSAETHNFNMSKKFHVSPFLPMDLEYKWTLNNPGTEIRIGMTCIADKPIFHAAMKLHKQELNLLNCLFALVLNPIATQLLHIRIYWQALFLFIKKTPFYAHN